MAETAVPQIPNYNVSNDAKIDSDLEKKYRKILFILTSCNAAVGTFLLICGFVLLGSPTLTFAEGIWCGIWVAIAGGLGIAASQPEASTAVVWSHRIFEILGITFLSLLIMFAFASCFINIRYPLYLTFACLEVIASLLSAALCIASMVYEKKIFIPKYDDVCCDLCCHCCEPVKVNAPQRVIYNQYGGSPYQQQLAPQQYQQQFPQQQFPQQQFQQQQFQQQQFPQQQFPQQQGLQQIEQKK